MRTVINCYSALTTSSYSKEDIIKKVEIFLGLKYFQDYKDWDCQQYPFLCISEGHDHTSTAIVGLTQKGVKKADVIINWDDINPKIDVFVANDKFNEELL